MECSVCCEKHSESTTSKRYKVTCNYCNYSACRGCVQRYIVESPNDPKCMSCNKEWNYEFICNSLQKTFINKEYKKYREKILLEREKSMLPDTQKYAEQVLHTEEKWKDIAHVQKQINLWKKCLEKKYDELYDIQRAKPKEKKDILHRICPVEECKGFIGNGWMCGICNVKVCNKCHIPIKTDDNTSGRINDTHECKKEDIDNATIIMKNTKPCPKCAVLIFKIDGCDQMFCSNCHTAFGWRSGCIETGVIHNPHYYEHLRRTEGHVPRNPLDMQNNCDRVVHHNFYTILRSVLCKRLDKGTPQRNEKKAIISFNYNINDLFGTSKNMVYSQILERLYIMSTHIRYVEIPIFRVNNQDSNRDLRIKYLLNRICEDEWKSTIQRREKKNMKKNELFQVLEMFVTVIDEIIIKIQKFHIEFPTEKLINSDFTDSQLNNLFKFYKDIPPLINYVNIEFKKIGKRFNNKAPLVDMQNLTFYRTGQ